MQRLEQWAWFPFWQRGPIISDDSLEKLGVSVMGQIGAKQTGKLIIAPQTAKAGRNRAADFDSEREHFIIHHNTLRVFPKATHPKTSEHFLFSGAVLILPSPCLRMCVCIWRTWPEFVLAASHKRPSVQSDKVPISHSCDSDFLSECPTATEGLSIQARAHILTISSNTNSYSQWGAAETAVHSSLSVHRMTSSSCIVPQFVIASEQLYLARHNLTEKFSNIFVSMIINEFMLWMFTRTQQLCMYYIFSPSSCSSSPGVVGIKETTLGETVGAISKGNTASVWLKDAIERNHPCRLYSPNVCVVIWDIFEDRI